MEIGTIPSRLVEAFIYAQCLSIALPTEMAILVRQAVDVGEYFSQSEVFRDALRDWTYKRNLRAQGLRELRRAWLEVVADDSDGRPCADP